MCLAILAGEYGQGVASGAALPVHIYDALDRKLAELIREYLRLMEQRPDR